MSTPYWGDVPQKRHNGHRRMSSDYTHPSTDQRQSLDSQPPRRVNRASVQTTYTEAPTESTFTPASPTSPSFAGQGLAPRPPSYQQPMTHAAPSDDTDRRPRRMPYDEEHYGLQPSPAMPAAPDVQRQPPLSYRPRYTDPANSQRQPPPPAGYPNPPRHTDQMGAAERRHPQPRPDIQLASNNAQSAQAAPQQVPANVLGQQRRTSASASSDRRKKLANGRSPLQKLELTLDSMTKEEKRARVQAAEQRARQRAALHALASEDPKARDVIARAASESSPNPPVPTIAQVSQPTAAPIGPGPNPTERRPSLRQDADAGFRRDHGMDDNPQQGQNDPRMVQPTGFSNDLPKRNLSFRDRAGRTSGIPSEADLDLKPHAAAPIAAEEFLPTRSGSNKLRKQPPEGFYQQQRTFSGNVPRQIAQAEVTAQSHLTANHVPPASRDKDLPPLPPSARQRPAAINNSQMPTDEFVSQGMRRRATEPIYGREYGSDEEYFPRPRDQTLQTQEQSHEPSQAQNEDDVALARRRLQRGDSDHSAQHPQSHRISNLIFKNPETMRPGDGLYSPPEWLDEWKNGTVGLLSGHLLEVGAGQASQDTYKAWWEEGGRRRATNVSARLRKAEAFDGEYDDTNNGKLCTKFRLDTLLTYDRTNSIQASVVSQMWPAIEVLWYTYRDFALQASTQRCCF